MKVPELRAQLQGLMDSNAAAVPEGFNLAGATKDSMAKIIAERRVADAKAEEAVLEKQWKDRLHRLQHSTAGIARVGWQVGWTCLLARGAARRD
eukprot:9874031-Alexandrium_andersonii.AAC.1